MSIETPLNECYYELVHLMTDQTKHDSICYRIQPFLSIVDDGGHLYALYVQLRQSFGNEILIRGMVHRLIDFATTNPKLETVIRLLLKK